MGQESPRSDWVSPYFILTYHHSKCADQGQEAVNNILRNASKTADREPWTVIHNGTFSPDGNPRSYVSWAPYWWPACCEDVEASKKDSSAVGDDSSAEENQRRQLTDGQATFHVNSTVLPLSQGNINGSNSSSQTPFVEVLRQAKTDTSCLPVGYESDPTLIYKNCVYIRRDGYRNPDVDTLKCRASMIDMPNAVLSNALAYGFTRDETFAQKAVYFIRAFFLDPRTGVMPNIDYGQVIRGPPGASHGQNNWSKGTFRGTIEWRLMTHVVNAIVILRACGCKAWSTLDAAQMSKWASDYLHWLETSPIALEAKSNGNNMASFYYNQIISLYILLGKTEEAVNQANEYFTVPFMNQIDVDGNQPLEASRQMSLHYLIFGLEAMVTNAKLADNLGLNMWSAKTSNGTTIQDALDYILQVADQNSAESKKELADLSAHVAAVLTAYGDRPDGRYKAFLNNDDATADPTESRTWRLYNQPCSFYSSPSKGHSVSSQKFH